MKISLFSFFSGLGILDLGFETNGYKIVYVNEYKKPFSDSYIYARKKLNCPFPKYGVDNLGIENIDKSNLKNAMEQEIKEGNLVGFIGCPPCPDFSIGGKNKGETGENGKLAKTYIDLIAKLQPDFFIFENVKGLVKTKKHQIYFQKLKNKLMRHRFLISDRILNALAFGVPQDRERVVMLGFNRDKINSCLKAKRTFKFDFYKNAKYLLNEIFEQNWPTTDTYNEDSDLQNKNARFQDLTIEFWFNKNNVLEHANAQDIFKVKQGKSKIEQIAEGDISRKSFKRLHRWRYSPTAAYGNNEVHLHPYKTRRLSVAETLAIQTLPKEFEIKPDITLSNKFKMVGNGVPYLMATSLAIQLKTFLKENMEEKINV